MMHHSEAYSYEAAEEDNASDEYDEDEDDSLGGDEDDDTDDEDDRGRREASSSQRRQFTEMKEQMYQDKLADLKKQLQQLNEGTLPEYTRRLRRAENAYRERIRVNNIIRDLEVDMVEQEFVNEKRASLREFEEQKVYLRENLIAELEEKQKMIETERHNMELTGDSMELKPIATRKLRRRANEPTNSGAYGPGGDKRRKPLQMNSMSYLLEDSEIIDDLKIINKNRAFSMQRSSGHTSGRSSDSGSRDYDSGGGGDKECRVVDGKLFYEKRWFRRGQAIVVEPRIGEKYPAMISAIGNDAIWVRKTVDNSKSRIFLHQIAKGKIALKRRAS